MSRMSLIAPRLRRGAGSRPVALSVAAGAAAMAATALWVRYTARRAERRHPPAGPLIDVDGVRLHYVEEGSGDPIVFLHGNGSMAGDFVGSALFRQLAQRHRVIAFDRPGFGYSARPRSRIWSPAAQAKLLLSTLQRLGIERPVIVGHSWAALVAVEMALGGPDAVRGLLLVSGYFYPTARLDAAIQSPPAIPILGDVMRYTVSPVIARLTLPTQVRSLFSPQPVPDAFWRHVPLEMMLRPWQLRAAAAESAMMIPSAASLAAHYREVRVPVTIAAGTEDRMVNYRGHSERLRPLRCDRLLRAQCRWGAARNRLR